MENEILQGVDGLYAVCFHNNKDYDPEKIREIFGRYGHVVNVRFSDPEGKKMVFVRYKKYNEVKRCLDDLNKTNELHVKVAFPSKKILQGVPNQQTRNFRFSKDKYSSNNQVSDTDFINYTKPDHNNFKHGNGQIRNVHAKLRNQHFAKGNFSKDIEGTKQSNEVPKNEDSVDDKTGIRHNDRTSDDDTQNTGDAEGKVNDGNRDVTHSDKEGILKNSDNRGQMLQNSHTTNGVIADGPPPLVASEDLSDDDDEEPEMFAKDVIIANLPASVDEYDVKRFAWRHDLYPVHVSTIETTGIKYNILFCHLWMENDYEAEMAEAVLGGRCMEGNTLLVARAEKLLSALHDGLSTFVTS